MVGLRAVPLTHNNDGGRAGTGSDGVERGDYAKRILSEARAPMASDSGSSLSLMVRAATAALLTFALLLPANAQFWGNSWGWRQQQPQQPYNPYGGGFGGNRQWTTGVIANGKGLLLHA